tara:strand:- start:37 stop:1800 length:1764 start_codon:yes stop_codon:yes gene_type:complete
MIDYEAEFPLPIECLPETLKKLLIIETLDTPSKKITVTSKFEKNRLEDGYEYLHMVMACVPQDAISSLGTLSESTDGVVEFSTPCCSELGGVSHYSPSVSGYDYVVASWGSSSHYSYFLAEKVWMILGLSPRVIGNSEQRIIYDDLSMPIIGVAEGDIASEYHWNLKRDIHWSMRNDYLRKYLWMTGCHGVRVFFYEAYIEDCTEVRKLMDGKNHYNQSVGSGWCELDIREHDGKLLLQIWASVAAVTPDLCKEQDIYSLLWAGDSELMSRKRVGSYVNDVHVYLDDRFLDRYEKDSMFDAVPFKMYGQFSSCPSYKGQWSFRDCKRVGRNLLKASLYELYRNIPEQEIYHVHQYAISEDEALNMDLKEEHIVSKSERLLLQLIELGENLSRIIYAANAEVVHPVQFMEFSREAHEAEGFRDYPIIQKMAQVAPLDMYEQDFLSRCKTLNEIIGKLKVGTLKRVLRSLGADNKEISSLQGLKLLQALLNILEYLNEQSEDSSSLPNSANIVDWKKANPALAPFFINNDLRNAEAHEAVGKSLDALEKIGFDISTVSDGYGKALDFILDGVIDAICLINKNISTLLAR